MLYCGPGDRGLILSPQLPVDLQGVAGCVSLTALPSILPISLPFSRLISLTPCLSVLLSLPQACLRISQTIHARAGVVSV